MQADTTQTPLPIPTMMERPPVPEPVMMPTVSMQNGAGAPSNPFPGMGDGGSDAIGSGGGEGVGGATPGGIPDVITDLTDVVIDARPANEQCMFCHGFDGEGTDEGPEIQHPVEDYSTWVIRTGREHPDYDDAMLAYTEEELPDEALAAIFTFLQSIPMPTTGEGLYHDHCENCHGADARGGVTTRDITPEGAMGFLNHVRQGAHPGEFDNRTEYMHAYTPQELTDEQVTLIFDYVQTL
jgi:mono/diheme cytochrome c family protein